MTAVAHRATVCSPPGLANTGQIARGLVFRVGERRQLPQGGYHSCLALSGASNRWTGSRIAPRSSVTTLHDSI